MPEELPLLPPVPLVGGEVVGKGAVEGTTLDAVEAAVDEAADAWRGKRLAAAGLTGAAPKKEADVVERRRRRQVRRARRADMVVVGTVEMAVKSVGVKSVRGIEKER